MKNKLIVVIIVSISLLFSYLNFAEGAVQRPTLFLNSQQVLDLRSKILTSHAAIWVDIKSKADSRVNITPNNYQKDYGAQLWQREVGDNIAMLAFVGLISGEQKYFDGAAAWARASCNYPTWGFDTTSDGYEYGLCYGHQLLGLAMLYDYSEGYLCDNMRQLIKKTLIKRATRQYNFYQTFNYSYLQNQDWISFCGMLSSGIALQSEYPAAKQWVDFTQRYLLDVSKVLMPDGASQEGFGYWTYGMQFLILDFYLSKQALNNDYYSNSTWWKNNAQYGMYLMTPRSTWSSSLNIVDLGDSRRFAWNGPEHLFRELARLNNDPVSQWFADQNNIASTNFTHWFNLISHNPAIVAKSPASSSTPTLKYFDNLGIVSARSDWSGTESMVVFKSGAPMGLLMNTVADSLKNSDDMGHVHPDANHFVIFANGEFLIKNNGYVQRQTKYHNTLLVDNVGQWDEKKGYFAAWPYTASRDPKILSAISNSTYDVIVGDASTAYIDACNLKTYIRKLIYVKPNVLIVVDDIEVSSSHNSVLNIFPETNLIQSSTNSNLFTNTTTKSKFRIENLTPSETSNILTTQTIAARSGGGSTTTQLYYCLLIYQLNALRILFYLASFVQPT
jgi:hypothetical protein